MHERKKSVKLEHSKRMNVDQIYEERVSHFSVRSIRNL